MEYKTDIKAYSADHLPRLFELFRTYFAESDRLLSAQYTDWLYGCNPFGRAKMVVVSQNDAWVGFVALVPIAFERAGERMPAYYAVNALVDPRHQGHSLFAQMIRAARAQIEEEGAVLVGHPNSQAIKTWHRANVHFQEVLQPTVAIPTLHLKGWLAQRTVQASDLDGLKDVLALQAKARDHLKVVASPAYLRWRYFEQPGNKYSVQLLKFRGVHAGIQITRKLRGGVHLLMDQFVADQDLEAAARLLPLATVCFVPESGRAEHGRALVPLPIKKKVPYFFSVEPRLRPADVRHLNLTASDF